MNCFEVIDDIAVVVETMLDVVRRGELVVVAMAVIGNPDQNGPTAILELIV